MIQLLVQDAAEPAGEDTSEILWMGERRRCAIADCVLLVLALVAVGVSALGGHGIVRLLVVLAATCVLPGSALLTRLPGADVLEVLSLAVGLSFTIGAACGLAMVWTGWWHPYGCALALAAGACVMLALDLRRNVDGLVAPEGTRSSSLPEGADR
jgi:uncharacterized membrane protein